MNPVSSLVEHALQKNVASVMPLGGGSISTAMKATLSDGEMVFVKTSPQQADMFPKEANGLRELAKADAIKIPACHFCRRKNSYPRISPPFISAEPENFF